MSLRVSLLVAALSLLRVSPARVDGAQKTQENLNEILRAASFRMPQEMSRGFVVPSDNDLHDWTRILSLFRAHSYDSCKTLLARYGYSLSQIQEGRYIYDIMQEDPPVRRGWGTFVYNRNHSKRLIIHVNHPVDDSYVLQFCTYLFRRSGAEWLLVAGTSKNALPPSSDAGRSTRSVIQRWHEMVSDLSHVSISVHGFNERSYGEPIRSTDLVVSNGRTSDEQWGISEISLAFRDSVRSAGFTCSLAMYDSGYSRLAGGWNSQGVFSNDSAGFGHWLYIEMSSKIRAWTSRHPALLSAFDHALDLTGRKVSEQTNRAFGLVSPRVVKIDSRHRMFFPPPNTPTYRIISFDPQKSLDDTIDVRLGNWMDFAGSQKTIAGITRIDTGSRHFSRKSTLARIIEGENPAVSSLSRLSRPERNDSSGDQDDERRAAEPLQVHRIPLQQVLASTFSHVTPASFRWEGVISPRFNPRIPTFQMSSPEDIMEVERIPQFLIPLLKSSYHPGDNKFVGIQMTEVLVNEIARLVTEHEAKDIGLLAEETNQGEYYLRIFEAVHTALRDEALR